MLQDLWVGAPGEAPGTPYENEGTVSHYISKLDDRGAWAGTALDETIRPDLPGISAYLGDAAYGSALAASPGRVLIGSPDADLDEARDAGYVEERRNLDADPTYEFKFVWSRNTPGVPGDPATGDHFGAAVATAHEYSLIGAPGVDVGKAKDAGSALLLTDVGSWSLPDRTVTYSSDGVPGAAPAATTSAPPSPSATTSAVPAPTWSKPRSEPPAATSPTPATPVRTPERSSCSLSATGTATARHPGSSTSRRSSPGLQARATGSGHR